MEKGQKTGVLIVEDSRIATNMLKSIIEESERYELIDAIENAANAELACLSGRINLVLMDVCTAGDESGLEHARKLKKNHPAIKVIIMTSMPEISFIQKARDAGCDSFWYKETDETTILSVMNRTMDGESVYPSVIPESKLGLIDVNLLTDRELEILRYLTTGASHAQIAKQTNISENTVKYHVKNLLQKTGYSSTTQMVVDAVNKRLILPNY